MAEEPEESVLANIGTASWSPEEGVAYEVALEGINQVISAYSALIGEARAAADPDAVAGWRQEQQRWADRRRRLSPAEPGAVRQVRDECRALLQQLRGDR